MVARKNLRNTKETTLRHVWLAAIGAAVVARREARTAFEITVEESGKLRERAAGLAGDAQAIARGGLLTVGESVGPALERFGAEVEARLGPMLVKLGLKPQVDKPVRQAKKSSARKAAHRAARKPAAGRAHKARA